VTGTRSRAAPRPSCGAEPWHALSQVPQAADAAAAGTHQHQPWQDTQHERPEPEISAETSRHRLTDFLLRWFGSRIRHVPAVFKRPKIIASPAYVAGAREVDGSDSIANVRLGASRASY